MARPTEFKHNTVVNRAQKLFWKKGYHNTSAQDLVTCLGVSRSSLYNTFGDKRGIFIEALKEYVRSESQGLVDLISRTEPNIENIRMILHHVVNVSLEGKNPKGCFMVNTITELGNTDKSIQDIADANIRDVVEALSVFIERGQHSGTISSRSTSYELALALFHNMTAIRVTTKVISDKKFHEGNINAIIELFKP